MPKFLDEPSWYNSRGILLHGVGVDTDERPGVGDVPCVHLPSGEINWRHLMVNGATSEDVNIYAPQTAPVTSGSVLIGNTGGAQNWQWKAPDTNNPGVLGCIAGESPEWITNTASTSRLLRSVNGSLTWSSATSTVNTFTVPDNPTYENAITAYTYSIGIATARYLVFLKIYAAGNIIYVYPTLSTVNTSGNITYSNIVSILSAGINDGETGWHGATGSYGGGVVFGVRSDGSQLTLQYLTFS